jgi:RNA polymerase sigma factor (sigma-70 family)
MSENTWHTVQMHRCVERRRAGERAAADELLGDRLEHLARKMLRGFPAVRRWAETGDVLQGAVLRLLNCLREVRPAGTRDFINLAGVQMRRELLDQARRFGRRRGEVGDEGALAEAAAPAADLDGWCRFHEAVEGLPALEREVVGLVFYHGWTQAQVAELLGVCERTVRRYWGSTWATRGARPWSGSSCGAGRPTPTSPASAAGAPSPGCPRRSANNGSSSGPTWPTC